MRSPLTGLGSAIEKDIPMVPEKLRIKLRNSVTNLRDIGAHLLSYHDKNKMEEHIKKQPVLLPLELLQVLSEKRYQNNGKPITFEHEFAANTDYLFIQVVPSALGRMLSNLMNNATDAFDGRAGKVILKLIEDNGRAKIIIEDNGKGIPKEVLDKINNNTKVTSGKEDGHGIGMGQVSDTLKENNGDMQIESEVGKGTTITITFPIIPIPKWFAQEIVVHKGDTIVILDDDPSIHDVWETRFKEHKDSVTLKHFTFGEETIDFIKAQKGKKHKIVLLTDYELLNQQVDGLDVIKSSKPLYSFLVTSHFDKPDIRDGVIEAYTKLLPKQLAPEIPIKIIERQTKGPDYSVS